MAPIRKLAVSLALLLLVPSIVPNAVGATQLVPADFATTQSVDQATNLPINRTQTFSVLDQSVYSWLKFVNVPSPSHNITWVWLDQNFSDFYRTSYTIPDPGQGMTWRSYYAWSFIQVAGHPAAMKQGLWEVDVYVDGKLVENQLFTIATTAVEIEPTGGFAWPSNTIAVYLDGGTPLARSAVAEAMAQWNASQLWFQAQYGLPSRPVYYLILSNNSSAPIKVSFSQVQSDSNWGSAYWNYNLDADKKFKSVTCVVSIDLVVTGGALDRNITLDDVALRDIGEHELGHCLGLWHTARTNDLMNHFSGSYDYRRHPSTLNLYVLYQLSAARYKSDVEKYYSLPASIPYMESPDYADITVSTSYGATSTLHMTTSVTAAATSMTVPSTTSTSRMESLGASTAGGVVLALGALALLGLTVVLVLYLRARRPRPSPSVIVGPVP
ncbi:MAG: hypothetical protein HY247_05450 [archaeon]|nr:MAG: hypothetical protein HY247_05450 [archaeon]